MFGAQTLNATLENGTPYTNDSRLEVAVHGNPNVATTIVSLKDYLTGSQRKRLSRKNNPWVSKKNHTDQ
ncbi:unnamed protein product [Clonostachys solani]|uniref:Uncharacterized protein n=1 Tax=Clonostachys solani TaxID=160281 RepID=A0A9N9W9W3_9HYPO|nr:unnamed protein product [Clonostachys solani]